MPFLSQTWANNTTPRLPQNLGPTAITPAMLADPSTILRNQIQNHVITETAVIGISTNPAAPLPGGPLPPAIPPNTSPPPLTPDFGGGPSNIAFLLGIPNPPPTGKGPNAQTFQMDAIFWIETVAYQVDVPRCQPAPAGGALTGADDPGGPVTAHLRGGDPVRRQLGLCGRQDHGPDDPDSVYPVDQI